MSHRPLATTAAKTIMSVPSSKPKEQAKAPIQHYTCYLQVCVGMEGRRAAAMDAGKSTPGGMSLIGTNMRHAQVLATDMDHISPSLMLFLDKEGRMLFNAGEGLQRMFRENKIKMQKVWHLRGGPLICSTHCNSNTCVILVSVIAARNVFLYPCVHGDDVRPSR